MSLHNSLYEITDRGERFYTLRFNASHPVFAGHFPGHPVVPGACLVQIAEELFSLQTGRTVRWCAVRNLKFRQPLTPDMEVTVTMQTNGDRINVQMANDPMENVIYASFSATYMCAHSDVQ